MTPEFVAEARRVYVPAAAWLRANGWRNNLRNEGLRLRLDYGFGKSVYDRQARAFVNLMRRTESNTFLGNAMLAEVTSLTQAIDYLVTAGVLPVEFHSIHASYVPEIDQVGDRVGVRKWSDQREVHWLEPSTEEPEGWEPLFRRVTETAGSAT